MQLLQIAISTDEIDSDVVDCENIAHPLDAPAGTPFLASVCGGLPQLVVRSHTQIDLEAWWFLNGTRWLRTDDRDVHIIHQLTQEKTNDLPLAL